MNSDEKLQQEIASMLAKDSHGSLRATYVQIAGPVYDPRGRPM